MHWLYLLVSLALFFIATRVSVSGGWVLLRATSDRRRYSEV